MKKSSNKFHKNSIFENVFFKDFSYQCIHLLNYFFNSFTIFNSLPFLFVYTNFIYFPFLIYFFKVNGYIFHIYFFNYLFYLFYYSILIIFSLFH